MQVDGAILELGLLLLYFTYMSMLSFSVLYDRIYRRSMITPKVWDLNSVPLNT